jgi:hypothetical protein
LVYSGGNLKTSKGRFWHDGISAFAGFPATFFIQKSMVFNDFQRQISTIFKDIFKIINQLLVFEHVSCWQYQT